jgi:hypothetical protein
MVKRRTKKSRKTKTKKWSQKVKAKGIKKGALRAWTCTKGDKKIGRGLMLKIRRTPVGKKVYLPKCRKSKTVTRKTKSRVNFALNVRKKKR